MYKISLHVGCMKSLPYFCCRKEEVRARGLGALPWQGPEVRGSGRQSSLVFRSEQPAQLCPAAAKVGSQSELPHLPPGRDFWKGM